MFEFLNISWTYPVTAGIIASVTAYILWRVCKKMSRFFEELRFPWHGLFIEEKPDKPRVPPVWLWILLGAVLLLGIAAALPRRKAESPAPKRHLILVSAGVESQSRELGISRIERLKKMIQAYAQDQNPQDEFQVVAVGVQPRVTGPWIRSDQMQDTLAKVVTSDAVSNWQAAFDAADQWLTSIPGILVIAAGDPAARYQRWLIDSQLPPRSCVYLRAGESASNVGITSVSVIHSPFQRPEETLVLVRFEAFSASQQKVNLRLFFDGKQLDSGPIGSLPADQPATLPISGFPGPGRLELIVDSREDAQPADNRAFAVIPPSQQLHIAVAQEDKRAFEILQRLALANLIQVHAVDPARPYDEDPPDIFITHVDPAGGDPPSRVNTLLIGGTGSPVRAMPVGIEADHPIGQGLGDVDFRRVQAWRSQVVNADAAVVGAEVSDLDLPTGGTFPLVWTQSRGRCRQARFAFDPFAFSNYQQVRKVPILLANALEWLAPVSTLPASLTAGASLDLNGIGPGVLRLERSDSGSDWQPVCDIQEDQGLIPPETLERAGLYRLRRGEQMVWEFAVNAAACPVVAEAGAKEQQSYAAANQNQEMGMPWDKKFWMIGGGLILLETLVYLFSSRLAQVFFRQHVLLPWRQHRQEKRIRQEARKSPQADPSAVSVQIEGDRE